MSKIINGVASEYEIPIKSTIVVDNDYDNSIKREDKPFIWISEEIFTLKRDKDKLQQENKQLKEVIEEVREVVKELELHYQQHPTMIPSVKLNKLLQILDKVKGE